MLARTCGLTHSLTDATALLSSAVANAPEKKVTYCRWRCGSHSYWQGQVKSEFFGVAVVLDIAHWARVIRLLNASVAV